MLPENPALLVVEDEDPIRDGLIALFAGQGWTASGAGSGAEALERLRSERFDLVILDLMIPPPGGLEILRALRALDDETPVLVLTALGAEDDIVRGLEAGADDYMTKPFGIKEIVARARGLLRRSKPTRRIVAVADASLDLDRLELTRGTATVRLTAREADLLGHLVQHRGVTVARDELLVRVWGYRDGSLATRTVDVHVQQLRAKLATIGAHGWIETIRGRGYVFGLDKQ